MADLSIYATTFNCGREPVATSFFAEHLFSALTTNLPPDLIVLSLQEIAPLPYSFLGGALLAPYFSRFDHVVQSAAQKRFGAEVPYETLVVRNVGLTGIMLFAKRDVARKVRWRRTAGVGVGVAEMGNKGAVGVRLALEGDGDEDEVLLTFVAAHLAPMEDACERRNQDWRSICESVVFERDGGKPSRSESATAKASEDPTDENAPLLSQDASSTQTHTLFRPPSHLFFLGDLNYRTSDTAPSPDAHQEYPNPNTSDPDDTQHFASLLPKDQLTRERRAGRTLHNLTEAPITFPPTYKYSSAIQNHVAKSLDSPQTPPPPPPPDMPFWASHRVPSWCDRILYLGSPKVHAYTALPIQPTSDHRPVALSCSLPPTPIKTDVKSPFPLKSDWAARRAGARRLELLVGLAAYLGWTWEGEALLLGTLVGLAGGWMVLRAVVGAV